MKQILDNCKSRLEIECVLVMYVCLYAHLYNLLRGLILIFMNLKLLDHVLE